MLDHLVVSLSTAECQLGPAEHAADPRHQFVRGGVGVGDDEDLGDFQGMVRFVRQALEDRLAGLGLGELLAALLDLLLVLLEQRLKARVFAQRIPAWVHSEER